MKKNSSSNTRRRELIAVFNHFNLNSEIVTVERLPEENGGKRSRIISEDEMVKLLNGSDDNELKDIMKTLRYTGTRIGTLLRINTFIVNFKTCKISIPAEINKGKVHGYEIDIDERISEIVKNRICSWEKYYEDFRKNYKFRVPCQCTYDLQYKFIFPGTFCIGAERYIQVIERNFKELCKKCGIEDCILHDFRRTFATMAYLETGDLFAVSRALGHLNVLTTERYLNLHVNDIRDLFEQVNHSEVNTIANY